MPRTIHTIGLAPADELARIVRAQLTATNPTDLQRAALDELEKRASPERERSRLLGRLVALDERDGTVHAIVGALEYTAAESTLKDRAFLPAGDRSSAPLYRIANELRAQLEL